MSREKQPFDPYRANRELERWLFDGVNQDSVERGLGRSSLHLDASNSEIAFYIVHLPNGDIQYLRPGEPGTPEAEPEQ